MDPGTKDGITLGIALLGAVLGVLNFWRAVTRDRVWLKVMLRSYITPAGGGVCIEVINLSFLPVTVSQIGFTLPDKKIAIPTTVSLFNGVNFPQRLEPRASFTYNYPMGTADPVSMAPFRHAFARTACGKTFKTKTHRFKAAIKDNMAA